MGKVKQLKFDLKTMYDVSSVRSGYDYWFFKLLNYLLDMFMYDGLPAGLPAREIEANLLLTGHATIFSDSTGLICIPTELFGFDKYYRPTRAIFGNVEVPSKELKIGGNCEVIFNNKIRGNILQMQYPDSGLLSMIQRYARMLADVESTLEIRLVNSRQTSFAIAKTQNMAEQVKNLYSQVEAGKKDVLIDGQFIEAFKNVDIAPHQDTETINDLLIARDKILATFFRDIGVKFAQEQKKAQLTEDEVTADEQLLLINPRSMLDERKEGIKRVNIHFGTNISVKLNPDYDRSEVKYNDNSENL